MSEEKKQEIESEPEVKEEDTEVEEQSSEENIEEEVEKTLDQLLEEAEAKVAEQQDHVLRIQAEMQNLRHRTEKDVQNAHKFALERFAKELLAVVDSMELGKKAATEEDADIEKITEGLDLTLKQMVSALDKFAVKQIEADGEKFNPELHEAVSMIPHEDVDSNTVINVVQHGYTLNDRVIRPAMVIVAQ